MYLHNIVPTYNNKQLHYNLLNVDKLYFRAVHHSQILKFKIQHKIINLVLMDHQLELTIQDPNLQILLLETVMSPEALEVIIKLEERM